LDLAQRLDKDLLRLSRQRNDTAAIVLGHQACGSDEMMAGKFALSRSHFEEALSLYNPISHRSLWGQFRIHPQVICQGYLGVVLFCLGFPAQAWTKSEAALASARRQGNPAFVAASLSLVMPMLTMIGDTAAPSRWADQLASVAGEQGFAHWRGVGAIYRGWAKVRNGDVADGLSLMRSGTAVFRATGAVLWMPHFIALHADAYEIAGQVEEALALLNDALEVVERIGERWLEAELNRQKGRLLLRQGHRDAAEEFYRTALGIAREQGAKMWELRAATSLARLQRDHGCRSEARDLLSPVYAWFTEGFATP
jgi:predicted ATPase